MGVPGCNYFRWFDLPVCERGLAILPGMLANRNKISIELADARVELDEKNAEIKRQNGEIVSLIEMNMTLVEQNKMLKKKMDEMKVKMTEMKSKMRLMRVGSLQTAEQQERMMNQVGVDNAWIKLWVALSVGVVGYFAFKMVK